MRLVVTRPQADSERTAAALRARGHEVLIAPLMRVEPVAADFSGNWGGVIITSANAPGAIAGNPARAALFKLPLFRGRAGAAPRPRGRPALPMSHRPAATCAIWCDSSPSGGPMRRRRCFISPARIAPPIWWPSWRCTASRPRWRVVYRAVTAPFPPALTAALKAGEVDAVLHFSKRSAENYLAGAAPRASPSRRSRCGIFACRRRSPSR